MLPFLCCRPGGLLTTTTAAVIAIGVVLTVSSLAPALGFTTLPWQFFGALALFAVSYLVLVEVTKVVFYAEPSRSGWRAARFSHPGPLRPTRVRA